jgi:hypothetical protein
MRRRVAITLAIAMAAISGTVRIVRRRVFICWATALAAFWVFANWPERTGKAGFFYRAGFPLTYAWGIGGRPQDFDAVAFALDCLIGFAVIFGLSGLCAWSRRSSLD